MAQFNATDEMQSDVLPFTEVLGSLGLKQQHVQWHI